MRLSFFNVLRAAAIAFSFSYVFPKDKWLTPLLFGAEIGDMAIDRYFFLRYIAYV